MQSNANELNPLENNSFKLTDLVDIGMLKELSEKFTEITGLTIGLFEYPDQTILFKTGWKKVCTDFHMAYPEAAKHCLICNRKLFDRLERQGQLVIEKCGNGMYDCATPIFIQDKLIACITTGQLLLEKPDNSFFRAQAKKYGFDEEEYIRAFEEVKVISEKDLLLATSFLGQIATYISESGYNNLVIRTEKARLEQEFDKRQKITEALSKSEHKIRTVLALAPEAFFHGDSNGQFMDVNEATIELTGYSREELLNLNMKDLFTSNVLDAEPLRYDILLTGKTLTKRRLLKHKKGNLVHIEMSSRLMPDGTYQCFAKDITESILAQEALNKSESRLRMFFECSQEGLIFHDKGIVVDVNIAMLEMSGYTDEKELVGKNIIDYISPAFKDLVRNNVLDKKTEKYEAEIVRSDGRIVPVEIMPRNAEFNDGRNLRIASMIDITERKKAEKLRDINVRRTQALLTLSEMINAPLDEITGFVLEELIRLTGSKIGYLAFLNETEDVLTMHAWSKSAMEECMVNDAPREYPLEKTGLWGESVRQRKPVITNDYSADNPWKKGYPEGHVALTRHLSVPIFDNDRIVAVIGVGNKDIDYYDECIKQLTILGSAMWSHIARQRVMKELIESREQFRLITENSNDVIVAFDLEIGAITYVSQGSGMLAKWDPDDVLGDSVYKYIHEDELDLFKQLRADIYEGRAPRLFKHRILLKDGSYSWFETSCQVAREDYPEKIKVVAVCRDISEKVKTEQLQKEKDLAEAASKAKSEFLANVSHEIRNPLNSIVGMAKTLSRTNFNKDVQEIVDAILSSSDNLLHIINDVLDLSKIEANRIELENKDFDVNAVFSEVSSVYKSLAEGKGLKFEIHKDASVPARLRGDGNRFRQMVINLTGNAVKFTDKGSVILHVSASTAEDGHTIITTEVSDTGIGIKKEDFGKLFHSFTQLDSSTTKKFSGTGLGLAIVKSFAEMMGGDIKVESEFGHGSRFILTIPFNPPLSDAEETNIVTDEPVQSECKVLLVEDDALNQMYLKGFLSSKGMIVDSAYNGLQALEKYDAAKYDIILMDGQMPQMDGFEATRIIREKETQSGIHTPIIAITGYAISGDEERFLKVGMDSYITKPFDENRLIEVIKKLTGK
ncbi:MAG: PAS domain S-box protein [Bacteroidales bacterium]|jgi:PAS domain S-box-containing protein|nr:PAS domain S-box protein [Bacteroidales bacterium]